MALGKGEKERSLYTRMKRIILLAALLVGSFCSHAQYESFFGVHNWSYNIAYYETCYTDEYDPTNLGPCTATEAFEFSKTNTEWLDSVLFFKSQYVFLREDTSLGQLFARYQDFDREYLLCDLSLEEGDTFHFVWPWNMFEVYYHGDMLVDSVRYYNGEKTIYLSCVSEYDACPSDYGIPYYNISLRFMEGIGPMYGFYPPTSETSLGILLCLYKDAALCYMTHEDLGCYQNCSGIEDYPSSLLEIWPNPTKESITLDFSTNTAMEGQVIIRDLSGRICLLQTITGNHTTISLQPLSPGMYLLTYVDGENRKITKKFVKE